MPQSWPNQQFLPNFMKNNAFYHPNCFKLILFFSIQCLNTTPWALRVTQVQKCWSISESKVLHTPTHRHLLLSLDCHFCRTGLRRLLTCGLKIIPSINLFLSSLYCVQRLVLNQKKSLFSAFKDSWIWLKVDRASSFCLILSVFWLIQHIQTYVIHIKVDF